MFALAAIPRLLCMRQAHFHACLVSAGGVRVAEVRASYVVNVGVARRHSGEQMHVPDSFDLAAVFCGELNLTTDAYAAAHDTQWLRPPEARLALLLCPKKEFQTERKHPPLLPSLAPAAPVLCCDTC